MYRSPDSMTPVRTQVAIIGAGPAGLMLGHLLHGHGIDSVIVENRSRDHVIERVRAGVLEQGTVDLMRSAGVAARLDRESLRHEGIHLAFAGRRHRVDMAGLTGGRGITIYGQNEVVKDLIDARVATGRPLYFSAAGVRTAAQSSNTPTVDFSDDGRDVHVVSDFIAGCDGFHGICRPSIPASHLQIFEREYPFGWLGILAEAPPSSDELVYSRHERGFALFSMRSHRITRLYLQCAPDESPENWSDDRIWSELRQRFQTDDGWQPAEGPILQKGVTGMRSFVASPMRYGRMFLAGDAAHIVPPTGAKGLNLAMSDVRRLADAFAHHYATGTTTWLDRYSDDALARVWRAQRFSYWMTSMLHKVDTDNAFDDRRRLAELEYLVSSTAAMTSLAENYVG